MQLVGALEVHADAPAAGDVAEGGGDERLADADRPEDEDVAGLVDEAQRDELGPHGPVVGDLGGVVPGSSTMAGSRWAARARAPAESASRRLTSSQSSCSKNSAWLRPWVRASARRSGRVSSSRPSLSRRMSALSSGNGRGRRAHRPASFVAENSDGVAREAALDDDRVAGRWRRARCLSRPRSSMRATRLTSTASASSARRHAWSTRADPHFLTRPSSR